MMQPARPCRSAVPNAQARVLDAAPRQSKPRHRSRHARRLEGPSVKRRCVPLAELGAFIFAQSKFAADLLQKILTDAGFFGPLTRGIELPNGFGDFLTALGKTFAELSGEIKNEISHRANAMKKFTVLLTETLKEYGENYADK